MLDLYVLPERSVGNEQWSFVLGMPLGQAVLILQSQWRIIKTVDFIYQDDKPLGSDLVLNLTDDGIKLIFDPVSQRLKIIELYDLTKLKLKYCDSYFNSPQSQPCLEQIEQSFGPMKPGNYDARNQAYITSFRGLTFFCKVSQGFASYFTEHSGTYPTTSSLPIDGRPILSRICVYSGDNLEETIAPDTPVSCYYGNVYAERVEVLFKGKEAAGLHFNLLSVSSLSRPEKVSFERDVHFGDSVQKVLSEIGSPSKVFYKKSDKMHIHSKVLRHVREARNADYFYNYFTLGIDILFDGEMHRVKKFILHTNYPGHYDFNIYYRCPLSILISEQTLSGEEKTVSVNPSTLWKTITHSLRFDAGKPLVLNRSSSINNTNPFKEIYFFGLRNLIFEVMLNDHIAAVTLFKPPLVEASSA